jgi:hypothetical protein
MDVGKDVCWKYMIIQVATQLTPRRHALTQLLLRLFPRQFLPFSASAQMSNIALSLNILVVCKSNALAEKNELADQYGNKGDPQNSYYK